MHTAMTLMYDSLPQQRIRTAQQESWVRKISKLRYAFNTAKSDKLMLD
jgi:hypothetical protein